MLYASHKPATFDLTGITPVQMDALRDALVMLTQANRTEGKDPYSDEFETMRVRHVAALELIRATNDALRAANGDEEN